MPVFMGMLSSAEYGTTAGVDSSGCVNGTCYSKVSRKRVGSVPAIWLPTMFSGELERISCALKVGSRDHEFGAPDLASPANDGVEVIWVSLGAVIFASEDGIG